VSRLAKKGFETLGLYGFSMSYPAVCRLEFNPKSTRGAGDVVFHFPDREKMFLSWGKLEDAKKRFATVEDQAEHSLKRVGQSTQVRNFDRISHNLLEINSHTGVYNRVEMQVSASFLRSKRTTKREALSLHLHCEPKSRYFVIHTMLSSNAPADFEDLFLDMVRSFKCH
jgi:hypothetical protein